MDEEEVFAGEEIIGNIDEDGYLRRDLAQSSRISTSRTAEHSLEKAELILKKIQRLDPVGIASRSLQECLLVQMEVHRSTRPPELALRVLTEFLR